MRSTPFRENGFSVFLLYCTCFPLILQWIFARKKPDSAARFVPNRVFMLIFCIFLRFQGQTEQPTN